MEERKLATIEKIKEIHPIPDADAIERALIRGWSVVIKKGDFKVGDLCVYCEIDSLMPEREEFEFLRPRNFRIKTVKLRGQISQGIAFPLNILEHENVKLELIKEIELGKVKDEGFSIKFPIGADVTEALGITKYEIPIPAELSGKVKGGFPGHSIKTDEKRIQNLIDHYNEYKENKWIATEKLDGTSGTFFIHDNEFGICSRNLQLKESDTNTFWKVAKQLDIENKMKDYMKKHNDLTSLTIQGEVIGEGIQKNRYRIKGQSIRFFRAFYPDKHQFAPWNEFVVMMKLMDLPIVPVIEVGFKLPDKYEDLLLYADGRSLIAETAREGVIFVAENPYYSDNGRLSFKVISNKFLLKE